MKLNIFLRCNSYRFEIKTVAKQDRVVITAATIKIIAPYNTVLLRDHAYSLINIGAKYLK